MAPPLRVLAIVPAPPDTSPGQRFRIEQWEPHLRREGIELFYTPFLGPSQARLLQQRGQSVRKGLCLFASLIRRLAESARASRYDLAYLFRESAHLGPALAERILHAARVPFVFDFDDAVWVPYVSPASPWASALRFPGKTATACRLARRVLAGNEFLAGWAGGYNPRVSIVPTTIDTRKYARLPMRRAAVPVIGWSGSFSTGRYLEMLGPALQRLRRRTVFRFVVIGAEGFTVEGVDVECRPWQSATEVEDLALLDVGVMPLPDTPWERGKCGLKALQYMALGIPAVVTPVGANATIVEDGVSGFHARSSDEWEERLFRLLGDSNLRARLGAAGRARVERDFSAEVHGPRVASLLREAGA